jgi:hypothetical protein
MRPQPSPALGPFLLICFAPTLSGFEETVRRVFRGALLGHGRLQPLDF